MQVPVGMLPLLEVAEIKTRSETLLWLKDNNVNRRERLLLCFSGITKGDAKITF